MKGVCIVIIVVYTLIITAHGYLYYDPCYNVNCGHGRCQVSNRGGNIHAYCECYPNYYGHHCTNPCHNFDCGHGRCHVRVSDHGRNPHAYCTCDSDFMGDHCETPDLCHNLHCGHGKCIVSNNGDHPHAYCECDASHYGDHCETLDVCHNFDCGNGLCRVSTHGGHPHGYCDCDADFYGDHCQTFDLCRNYLCHNGGDCQVNQDVMRPFCKCHRGYFGPQCIYEDPCIMSHPCQHGGTCHFSQQHHVKDPFHIPEYNCTCSAEYTGHDCEILKTTTSTATTTTAVIYTATGSTITDGTTTATSKQYLCNKTMAIMDLANNHVSHNVISSSCVQGDGAGSEAFVMNHCNIQNPTLWQKGQQVMTVCDSLPIYTPIATFKNGKFVPGNDTTAIFLGCLGGEMRVGLQTCDVGARIEHFSPGEIDFKDANVYYIIQ